MRLLYQSCLFLFLLSLGGILPFYLAKDTSTLLYGYDEYGPLSLHNQVLVSSSMFINSPGRLANLSLPLGPMLPCDNSYWLLKEVEGFNLSRRFSECYRNLSSLACLPTPFSSCTGEGEVQVLLFSGTSQVSAYLYYYALGEIRLNYRFNSAGRVHEGVDITSLSLLVDLDLEGRAQGFKSSLDSPLYPAVRWNSAFFSLDLKQGKTVWAYVDQDYKVLDVREDYPYSALSRQAGIAFWHFFLLSCSLLGSTYAVYSLSPP